MKIDYIKDLGILVALYKSMLKGFIVGLILYYVKVDLDKRVLKEQDTVEQLRYGGVLGILATLYTAVRYILN